MSDPICVLELPQTGPFHYVQPFKNLKPQQVGQLALTFGEMAVSAKHPKENPEQIFTYSTGKNLWLDQEKEPIQGAHPTELITATETRCKIINEAFQEAVNLQAGVADVPITYLRKSPAHAPERSEPRMSWRRAHSEWLDARCNEVSAAAKKNTPSPQERHFRAAANILANLTRPVTARLHLMPATADHLFTVRLCLPEAAWHVAPWVTTRNGRLAIDQPKVVSAARHGRDICLSHAAALICALGRLETSSGTALTLEIVRETKNGAETLYQLTTRQKAWTRLIETLPETATTDLPSHPDLILE